MSPTWGLLQSIFLQSNSLLLHFLIIFSLKSSLNCYYFFLLNCCHYLLNCNWLPGIPFATDGSSPFPISWHPLLQLFHLLKWTLVALLSNVFHTKYFIVVSTWWNFTIKLSEDPEQEAMKSYSTVLLPFLLCFLLNICSLVEGMSSVSSSSLSGNQINTMFNLYDTLSAILSPKSSLETNYDRNP